MGRSGSFTKTTSGGSAGGRSQVSTNQRGRPIALGRVGRRTDGIRRAEPELEPVCLILVERVAVEHLDVQQPFLKVIGRNQLDPWRQRVADLKAHSLESKACDLGQDVANLLELFTQSLRSKLRRHVEL